MKKILLLLLTVCLSMNILAQRVINLNDGSTAGTRQRTPGVAAVIPQRFLSEAREARAFVINPALQSASGVSVGDTVNLQLFEGKNYKAVVNDITTDVNGNFTLSLKLTGYLFAFAVITTDTAGNSLVNVSVPELDLTVVSRISINSDTGYLLEIDKKQMAVPCEEMESLQKEMPVMKTGTAIKKTSPAAALACTPVGTPTDPAQIDILMLYTPVAEAWAAAEEGGIANTIAAAMAQTKAVVDNQGNGDVLRLVHSQRIDYTEFAAHEMTTDLNRLTDIGDGYLDEVHQLRAQYNADIVVLVGQYDNPGGLGWVMNNVNGSSYNGFNIVRVQQISFTTTSIHEIGHNMGMRHNAEDNSSQDLLYPYALGWHWTGSDGKEYGSVMSYIGEETPYFSNPDVIYRGQPAGTATANNARVFRNTKHVVALYSDKLAGVPAAPTNIVVSNPTSNGATFSWDAVPGAATYRVIGPGGWYYTTSNTTYTVNNNNAEWYPATCSHYSFSIQAVGECGDAGGKYTATFRTFCPAADPVVITMAAANITGSSAKLNSTLTVASDPVTAQGFKYRAAGSDEWLASTDGSLSALIPGTEYLFYAYAVTASGTFNGSVLAFTTSACAVAEQIVYNVETRSVYSNGWYGAELVVEQNGVVVQRISPDTYGLTSYPVPLCPCRNLEFVWIQTDYDVEKGCSFVIKDSSSNTVFQTPAHNIDDPTAGCGDYANNQTIFSTEMVCVADPLETFKIKWTEADGIIQPTSVADGVIHFNSIASEGNTAMEVYFMLKPAYRDYRTYLLNAHDMANDNDGTLLQSGMDYHDNYYSFGGLADGRYWEGMVRVVNPLAAVQPRSLSDYSAGDIVAEYSLVIENGVFTGLNEAGEQPKPVAFYNTLGIRLQNEPASGIYIIVYDNGEAMKAVK